MTKTVPFNDLTRIHNSIEDKVMSKFSKIVKKNSFVLNKEVEEFEIDHNEPLDTLDPLETDPF